MPDSKQQERSRERGAEAAGSKGCRHWLGAGRPQEEQVWGRACLVPQLFASPHHVPLLLVSC